MKKKIREHIKRQIALFFAFCLCLSSFSITSVYAEPEETTTGPDYMAEAEARKSQSIQSNQIISWPQGPAIGAEGAILMEANTGAILYAKNIDEKLYPASTTKILTTLVAMDHVEDLQEMVKFSHNAVFSIERDSSNMGMDEGQSITVEQCLYGILVYSANEVCNAIAEHIAGSTEAYVELMNQKAAELGCTNSHFVTTNGLHDTEHYTTPRDLATIGCAFFNNDLLAKISGTAHYYIGPTPTQPDDIDLYTHNQLTKGTYSYEGYIGGKTGFTSDARQTLVSCAERNGIKLVCVIMKEESPNQFTDTMALFDYGFQNFQKVNVAEHEKDYIIHDEDMYHIENNIFYQSESVVSIDEESAVILPNTAVFEDLEGTLSYENLSEGCFAHILYNYNGQLVGRAKILLNAEDDSAGFMSNSEKQKRVIFINMKYVLTILVIVVTALVILTLLISYYQSYNFTRRRRFTIKGVKNRHRRR
ncbi:MAG: D-alanyl-D-alanine carboxypeptidase [Lachnospiraceae bacterium]|nr:D-alanyl-D-alanine carboxypeptidase [Lachnospiraceae bacterium]